MKPDFDMLDDGVRLPVRLQCFSWVGTAFPQIFPCVFIFFKVEITPPVYYATS
jgi:hypothetical protein